jgi:hypothetical protein
MKRPLVLTATGLSVALLVAAALTVRGDPPFASVVKLQAHLEQKEVLSLEPILVTLRLEGNTIPHLPAMPGKAKGVSLRFVIKPEVKPRPNAKPLPVEGKGADLPAKVRTFDLLEWYQFPAEGEWAIEAIVESEGNLIRVLPQKLTIRKPAKGDKEYGPVDRLHHLPWSNYTTNAFCGDTFDLVKRWPESRLARYAHYYNGVYQQHKKEHAKALESYRAAAKYSGFVLADHARYGAVECLLAQGKKAEAAHENRLLRERAGRAGLTTVLLLAHPIETGAAEPAKGGGSR